jgi:putative glutamine amidotransferase
MKNKPIIGIAPGLGYDNEFERPAFRLNKDYTDAIDIAGGLPFLFSFVEDVETLAPMVELCDGIVLSGGQDVDANSYGGLNYHDMGCVSPERDHLDFWLARYCVKHHVPILAICRGAQVLNAAMGGTLMSDLSRHPSKDLLLHWQKAPSWHAIHPISIVKDTLLWQVFKKETINVNSFHHQAIDKLAPGLKITATSPDGIIEAVEAIDGQCLIGIQSHPEMMWQRRPDILELFKFFIEHAKQFRQSVTEGDV